MPIVRNKNTKHFIKRNSTKCNNVSKFFIIPYLYETQHVSDDTPPIMRSLNCTHSLWFFMLGKFLDV
jgi:hypothetical protein